MKIYLSYLKSIFFIFLLIGIFFLPIINNIELYANNPLVTNSPLVTYDGVSEKGEPCGFDELLAMIERILKWIIQIAFLIAVIMFLFTGFKILKAGGKVEELTKTKESMLNIVIGIVLIACAWLIVGVVFDILGLDPDLKLIG